MTKNGVSIKSIVASVILALVIIGMAVAYFSFRPQGVEGEKNISVTVIHKDKTTKEIEIVTSEEFLRAALESENLIGGKESDYGLFLTIADNEEADSDNEEWWCVRRNGELISYSVDSQPILDGDKYELELITGYNNY